MKTLGLAILFVVGSTVLLSQPAIRIKADIPFAFELANHKVPAGEYTITAQQGERSLLVSTSSEFIASVLRNFDLGRRGVKDGAEIKLVFNKYGDRYFLSEVWAPNDAAHGLLKSKNERTMVTSTLITAKQPDRVVILARAF